LARSSKFASELVPVLGALALILAVLTVYLLRVDDVAGIIGDDAWYVVLAKGIAEGSGPRLISSAGTQFLSTVYPPGFPAILSLVFLISPQFPANMALLKGLSIVAMIGAGALTFRYAVHYRALPRSVALAVAVATVLTPALVFLATSTLMSEPVFLFIQILAVLLIERTARAADDRSAQGVAVLAGVIAAAAFLTRTAGMTVAAAGLFYLAQQRRWRSAAVFGGAAALCVVPWLLYARAHAPTRAELVDHGGLMAIPYADQFWTTEAGTITAPLASADMLPGRVVDNVINVSVRDIGGIFVPLLFRSPSESGLEVLGLGPPDKEKLLTPSMGMALGTQIVSVALTLLGVVGFVAACRRGVTVAEPLVVMALGMIVLWPFWTFRFVLPLVPFLLIYLALGAETLGGWLGRLNRSIAPAPYSVARIFLLVLIGLHVMDHSQYIALAAGNPQGGQWKSEAAGIHQVLGWIREHPVPPGAVAADNPALVYLYTGRRTVAIDSYDDNWSRWRRMGVRYVVSLVHGLPLVDPRAELRFKLPERNVWAYELIFENVSAQSVASTTHIPDRAVLNSTR
jgi:hypothetical protein